MANTIYTVRLDDGSEVDIEGPEGASEDQLRAIASGGDVEEAVPNRSAVDSLRMGIGDVAQGVGDLVGIAANPLAAGLNATGLPQALTGGELGTDAGGFLRDLTGAPDPVSPSEKMTSVVVRGGTGALSGAGVAQTAAHSLTGVAGKVATEIGSNPVRDLIAGLTGGAGAEVGQNLGGVPGALVGGLAGSMAGLGVVRLGERAATAIAERFPQAAIIDSAGALTDDGREIALRTGADPEEIARSYARVRERTGSRPSAGNQAAREANRGTGGGRTAQSTFDAQVQVMVDRGASLQQVEEAARAAGADPSCFQGLREAIAYRDRGGAERVRVLGPDGVDPTQALNAKTAGLTDAIEQRLPQADAGGAPVPPTSDGTLLGDASSEGIRLTRGQAEQDFAVQNDENNLFVSANADGNAAREFKGQQQQQIQAAVTRFQNTFGDLDVEPEERGKILQSAVGALRDAGADGVRQLYGAAEALGGDGLRLETAGIRDAATDVLIDEAVPEGVKRAVSQELARYGIIGEAAPMNEAGLTRVTLEDGSGVSFRGPVKELTASNADDLRKAINRLYDPMKPNQSGQSLKPAIDDALEEAITGLPQEEGRIGAAYQAARSGYRQQKRTFEAKDVIENLVASKRGTDTPKLSGVQAIAATLGTGPKALSNIRSVRNLLMSSRTPSATQAWRAIQQQGLADIFGKAMTRAPGPAGEMVDYVSGARLTTARNKFGRPKLRVLLDDDDFTQLMKLERVIGAATVPMSGTTNPSGSAMKLMNFMIKHSGKMGGLGDAAISLINKAKMAAASRRTLRGITSYEGPAAQSFMREYIDSGRSGRLVPSTISMTSAQPGRGN